MNAGLENGVVLDGGEELAQPIGHVGVAFVDASGEDVMRVGLLQDLGEAIGVGEGEPRTFIIDKASFEFKNQSIGGDDWGLSGLIGAVSEDLIKEGATRVFEAADLVGGDLLDLSGVICGGQAEFIDNSLLEEELDDVGVGPGGQINAVGDGFEFDFVAGEVVVVGDSSVKFADAGTEFGDFDGDGGEADAAVFEFVTEPLADGRRFEVGEDEALELIIVELGFGGLNESVVGVESMLARCRCK